MGLIQKAKCIHNPKSIDAFSKKKSSLLARINATAEYDVIHASFKAFLDSMGFERGGIVYPTEENVSLLLFGMGLDLTSRHRFSPVFSELLQRYPAFGHWYTEFGFGFDRYRTFFSSHEADSAESLHFLNVKLTDTISIFILLIDSKLDIVRNKKGVDSESPELRLLIDALIAHHQTLFVLSHVSAINQSNESIKTHIESALRAGKNANLVSISFSDLMRNLDAFPEDSDTQEMYFGIVYQLLRQAGSSNIVRVQRSLDVVMVLFTAQPMDTDLYFHQLVKPLEQMFGAHRISRLIMRLVGTSNDFSVISDFVFGKD
jgi:hypothetical protein